MLIARAEARYGDAAWQFLSDVTCLRGDDRCFTADEIGDLTFYASNILPLLQAERRAEDD